MYPVKAAAELSGLTPETLRAWERRHAAVVPHRDAQGRRLYDAAMVDRLARLHRLTGRGHPIRDLAGLDDAALDALLEERRQAGYGALDALPEQLLDAVADYRVDAFDRELSVAIATLPLPVLLARVVMPLLREVGVRWADGRLAIAQERLGSSMLRARLLSILNQHARAQRPPVVFATLSGEPHELGLLGAALHLHELGLPVLYLGTELPAPELARVAKRLQERVFADPLDRRPGGTTPNEGFEESAGDEIFLGVTALSGLDDVPAGFEMSHRGLEAFIRERLASLAEFREVGEALLGGGSGGRGDDGEKAGQDERGERESGLRERNHSTAGELFHVLDHLGVIVTGGPDRSEKIRRGDVVLMEELTIPSTAEHGVRVEFSPQLGAGFYEDAREPDESVELFGLRGEAGGIDHLAAGFARHDVAEVVAPHARDHHRGRGTRVAFVGVVLDEVKELARFVADGAEEGPVLVGVIAFVLRVAAPVAFDAAMEEIEKCGVPAVMAHVVIGLEMGGCGEKGITCSVRASA